MQVINIGYEGDILLTTRLTGVYEYFLTPFKNKRLYSFDVLERLSGFISMRNLMVLYRQ